MGNEELLTETELLEVVRKEWLHWARHLGLENWWIDVALMTEPNEEDTLTITWHPGQYHRAYLKVNPAFKGDEANFPVSLRVLHEALHIKYSALDDLASETAPVSYQAAWKRHIETECDETAAIVWRLHALTACEG